MEFGREDWILVAMAAFLIIPLGYNFIAGDSSAESSPIAIYCEDTARNIEENSTLNQFGADCSCIPPGEFDPARFQTAELIENNSEIFLVSCSLENGRELIFPVRKLVRNVSGVETGLLNGTNLSGSR